MYEMTISQSFTFLNNIFSEFTLFYLANHLSMIFANVFVIAFSYINALTNPSKPQRRFWKGILFASTMYWIYVSKIIFGY